MEATGSAWRALGRGRTRWGAHHNYHAMARTVLLQAKQGAVRHEFVTRTDA